MFRIGSTSRGKTLATFAVGLLVVLLSGWTILRQTRMLEPSPATPRPDATPAPRAPAQTPENNVALRYAKAVQDGNCDIIIPHTAWMRERLKSVLSSSGAAEEARVRADLCDRILDRAAEGNQLRKEGVEDQYVFAPGVDITWVSEDAGRADLSDPVRRRTWIRVTYPARNRALADLKGRLIHAVVVGVNVSADDMVLKANVKGNVEIDYASIKYDWPSPQATGG